MQVSAAISIGHQQAALEALPAALRSTLLEAARGQALSEYHADVAHHNRRLFEERRNPGSCNWVRGVDGEPGTCTENAELALSMFRVSREDHIVPLLKCVYLQFEEECNGGLNPRENWACEWDANAPPGTPRCGFQETKWFEVFAMCLPKQSINHNMYNCLSKTPEECVTPCGRKDDTCVYELDEDAPAFDWVEQDPITVAETTCASATKAECEALPSCSLKTEPEEDRVCELTLRRALELLVDTLSDANHDQDTTVCDDYLHPLLSCMLAKEPDSCSAAGPKCQWDKPDAFRYSVDQFGSTTGTGGLSTQAENTEASASPSHAVQRWLTGVKCHLGVSYMLDYYFPGDNPALRQEASPLQLCYRLTDEEQCRLGVVDTLGDSERVVPFGGFNTDTPKSSERLTWLWVLLLLGLVLLAAGGWLVRAWIKRSERKWAQYSSEIANPHVSGYVAPETTNPVYVPERDSDFDGPGAAADGMNPIFALALPPSTVSAPPPRW